MIRLQSYAPDHDDYDYDDDDNNDYNDHDDGAQYSARDTHSRIMHFIIFSIQ